MRGEWAEAKTYCMKEGNFWSAGREPLSRAEQGQRGKEEEQKRWRDTRVAATEGRLEDVPDDIYVRYYSALNRIKADNQQRPESAGDVTGVWVYGPPGTGKSRLARHEAPDAFIKPNNKWWCGYKNEPDVIMDDVDPGVTQYLANHLKLWLDRYAFRAEVKGSNLLIRPKRIIITSNYSPADCFPYADQVTRDAILRRLKVVHLPMPLGDNNYQADAPPMLSL